MDQLGGGAALPVISGVDPDSDSSSGNVGAPLFDAAGRVGAVIADDDTADWKWSYAITLNDLMKTAVQGWAGDIVPDGGGGGAGGGASQAAYNVVHSVNRNADNGRNGVGGSGDDTIYGGEGEDTAVFAHDYRDYRFTHLADGSLQVDEGGILTGIEWLRFADRTIDATSFIV